MSKQADIYHLIVADLIGARYRFGDRILVKELAASTGNSRQPIMAALGRLAVDGFVQIVPQVGCQVVNPDRNAIADFYLMFGRIEGLLTELAAERRDARDLRQLTDLHRQIIAFTQDTATIHPDYRELNQQFHQMIHDMARSPLIDERQHSLFNMSDFFISQSAGFGAMQVNGLREHDEIVEAIARQSTAGARYAAEAHIASVSATVLSGLALALAADEDEGSSARARRLRVAGAAG